MVRQRPNWERTRENQCRVGKDSPGQFEEPQSETNRKEEESRLNSIGSGIYIDLGDRNDSWVPRRTVGTGFTPRLLGHELSMAIQYCIIIKRVPSNCPSLGRPSAFRNLEHIAGDRERSAFLQWTARIFIGCAAPSVCCCLPKSVFLKPSSLGITARAVDTMRQQFPGKHIIPCKRYKDLRDRM